MVQAEVAIVAFEHVVRGSDLIAVARVVSVEPRLSDPRGHRFARASVIEVWKGSQEVREIEFLASPTWPCDMATAEAGETVVLFLERESSEPYYTIAHAGRGRMPIHTFAKKRFATFWGDMILPKGTRTEQTRGSRSGRSIEVSILRNLVLRAAGPRRVS